MTELIESSFNDEDNNNNRMSVRFLISNQWHEVQVKNFYKKIIQF
jgi:hypothetical protein